MMQILQAKSGWWSPAALLVLMVLAGCAGGGKIKPESVETPPPVAPISARGPTIARLPDGREGFTITENLGQAAEAQADFETAVVLMKEGREEQAIPLLEKVIARSPDFTAPYINLAIAYKHLGKLELAEKQLQTALTLIPGHPLASNEYGLLLRQKGRFAEARTIYQGSLTLFPEYFPLRRNLGILCDLYLNDLGCALEQYEIYSRTVPEDAQVTMWIADLRARLGGD